MDLNDLIFLCIGIFIISVLIGFGTYIGNFFIRIIPNSLIGLIVGIITPFVVVIGGWMVISGLFFD